MLRPPEYRESCIFADRACPAEGIFSARRNSLSGNRFPHAKARLLPGQSSPRLTWRRPRGFPLFEPLRRAVSTDEWLPSEWGFPEIVSKFFAPPQSRSGPAFGNPTESCPADSSRSAGELLFRSAPLRKPAKCFAARGEPADSAGLPGCRLLREFEPIGTSSGHQQQALWS